MGIDEFWLNLRTAARSLALTASTDSPGLDPDALAERLQSAAIWLTPRSVEDFDLRDFTFLEPAERERLERSVDAFRRVASEVPADQSPSPQHIREAGAAFADIIHLLRPHVFPCFEAFQIQYQLERELRGKLPPWIERFVSETGTDVADDPAIWVTLYVSQEAVDNDLVVKEGQRVRDQVEAAVRRLRIRRWPYVRFQSLDELAASRRGRC